jgi:hypothetical protein
MAAEWFLAREGQQTTGPLTAQQLKQLAVAGQVRPTSLVWKEGMTRWVPASQVKGLLEGLAGEPGASAPGGAGPGAAPPGQEPEGARVLDWRTAGPPRIAAPGAESAAEEPLASTFREDLDEGLLRPEPWYYGFLEKYATVAMWLGILACGMGFLAFVVETVLRASRAPDVAAVLRAVVALVLGLLVFGLAVLTLLFQAALILLAVDAGRHLRSLEAKIHRR